MRIMPISNGQCGKTVVNNKLNTKEVSFQGIVNGNYYKDDIIALAKKYRNSSTWKKELREDKKSVLNAIASWHNDTVWGGSGDPRAHRFCLGLFTFGIAEVLSDICYGVSAAFKNKRIENTINEIAKCIDDLNKG